MKNILTIVFALLIANCGKMSETSFVTQIKEVFFDAELQGSYYDVINYYRTVDLLKEIDTEGGWTTYPPLSGLGKIKENTRSNTFKFKSNPKLLNLKEGEVVIEEGRNSGKVLLPELQLCYHFNSKEDAEKAYKQVIEKFDKLTTHMWKQDFKIIKVTNFYSSEKHKDGIRLSLYQLDNLNTLTISVIR